MSKYRLYMFFCCCISSNVFAQQSSLPASARYISLIKNSAPDTNRCNLYVELGKIYRSKITRYYIPDIYSDSAEWAFKMSLRLADSLHLTDKLPRLKSWVGMMYFYRQNDAAGDSIFNEVIAEHHKNGKAEKEAATWQLMAETRERTQAGCTAIIGYLASAIELYRLPGQQTKEARALLMKADVYLLMGNTELAEQNALGALHTYRKMGVPTLYDNYYLLSVINRYQGDLDGALLYANLCIENVDSLPDKNLNRPFFYGELALVYDALGLAEESAKWYRLSLDGRIKAQEQAIIIFRTAGLLIHQLVKINKKQQALDVMLGLLREKPPTNKVERAAIAQNLGYCYQAIGSYDKAEKYFQQMLGEFDDIERPDEFQSMAYQDIGNFYLATKKFDKAVQYLSKAIGPPETYLVSRQRDMYLSLYTADSAMGNYLAAINDFRTYKLLTDSIFSERKTHQIEELQIKYHTEKKEKDIILLNSQNKAQESLMQRSAMIRNLIIAGVLLLAGFLYYRYRLKAISNRKMQEQQRLINQKNLSLTQLVNEKEWLVKEIHHRVKNNFHTVMGLLAAQSQFLKNPEAISAMRESRHRIQAMSLIHQKLYQSENLSTISMPAYIRELVNSLRESYDIPTSIQFSFDIDPVAFDVSHAIPLGLILNEAITNAIKYAFPEGKHGVVDLSLKKETEDKFLVTVHDNGIGLSVPATHREHTMGMKLMKGLAEDMEGSIEFSGHDGTTIQITFLYKPDTKDKI